MNNSKTTYNEAADLSPRQPEPAMEFEELRLRLAAEGLRPTDGTLQQIFDALPVFEAMRARVRADYDMADEPCLIFSARLGL